MFDGHFSDEAVELLVAAVYTDSDNLLAARPNHYFSGFCRVLHLLSEWDWTNEPLVINLDGDLTHEDYHNTLTRFESTPNRKHALFIAYRGDMFNSLWTVDKPNKIVFGRVQQFARQTLQLIQKHYLDLTARIIPKWKLLLQPSFQDYDLLLKLKPEALPRLSSNVSMDLLWNKQSKKFAHVKEFKNLHGNISTGLLIDFDPQEHFFRELEERFGSLGMLFHNKFGKWIGIIWNPMFFLVEPKFQPHQSINRQPLVSREGEVVGFFPNIVTIIQEIQSIGAGILDKIEIPKGARRL